MSAKKAWRLGAWGALAMSCSLVSMGACSSSHDNGTDGGAATTNTTTTTTTTTSAGSSSTVADSGGTSAGGACGLPSPGATNGTLYTGGIPAPGCPSTLASGWPGNSWFGYADTATEAEAGIDAAATMFTHAGALGGCDGANDCAFHTTGTGIPGYGAGVGFTLANNAIFNATQYMGLQVWLMGTTTGTRGLNFSSSDNTVHVKFVTALPDGGDERNGDDFGAYCPTMPGTWTVCKLPFAGLTRDGFRGVDSGAPDPTTDMFDPQNLQKIQFEISSFTPPADASDQTQSVTFDIWIDDVAFF